MMLEPIISQFTVPGTIIKAERFGDGLINDTYLCQLLNGKTTLKYILQRINTAVFKHPEQVMENVEVVTSHISGRLRVKGIHDPSSVTPVLVPTRKGKSFLLDDAGAYWRMFHFIESGLVFDRIESAERAYEIGRGLGAFQSLLADLSPAKLHDTLPGFHVTPKYLADYDEALAADVKKRAHQVTDEQKFVHARRSLAPILTDLIAARALPLRVVHNDPKVNNVMIHAATGKALCMLDLDTVKPGIVHFDFGDCVRSAANPSGENAPDLDSVRFDLSLYAAVRRGYLREAGAFLTLKELALLPKAVEVLTFELGIRFLADYLRGDTYFKINYPSHNLHRARVQFKLLQSIESMDLHRVP
ncbi:MAG TPA: aminoglycoside phosphotransferase family protein [Nitrospirota bacterium]|nr:aminoglycoside phosphotransferase family protein [Nitrospirota bacterium]